MLTPGVHQKMHFQFTFSESLAFCGHQAAMFEQDQSNSNLNQVCFAQNGVFKTQFFLELGKVQLYISLRRLLGFELSYIKYTFYTTYRLGQANLQFSFC